MTVIKPSPYRAAYWTDGNAEVVLTLPEHSHLDDDALLEKAYAEAEREGLDISYGVICVCEWRP